MSPHALRARLCLVISGSALAGAAATVGCSRQSAAGVDAGSLPSPSRSGIGSPTGAPTAPSTIVATNEAALASAKAVDVAKLPPSPACAGDDLRETLCGTVSRDGSGGAPPPFSDCTLTGEGLESYGESTLKLTSVGSAHDKASASLHYDAIATASYRPKYIAQTLSVPNPRPACCFTRCSPRVRGDVPAAAPPITETCIATPKSGRWVPAAAAPTCPAGVFFGGSTDPSLFVARREEKCCYTTFTPPPPPPMHPRGRPLRVSDASIVAPRVTGGDWTAPLDALDVDALPAERRRALASAWAEVAAAEHASVAAFAKLTLELLAFGAPAELVSAAQRAGADEVRHARDAYSFASAFAGEGVQPGPLDVGAMTLETNLVHFACSAFVEGCVDETLAALEADEAARVAAEPAVARTLKGVARDEARHAELSWRVVAWAIERGGDDVRAAVREEAERASARGPAAAELLPAYGPELETFGVLSPSRVAAVHARGLREVVTPCARELLSGRRESASSKSIS